MRPSVGARRPVEHFYGGGFSGAVGAEKAEELAWGYREIYVIYG